MTRTARSGSPPRWRAGWALVLLTVLVLSGVRLGDTAAAASTSTATVRNVVEAWFAVLPAEVCTSPVGCPPSGPTPPVYPDDTLHVGVQAGEESARTYLMPDLTGIPPAARVESATMSLPLSRDQAAGGQSPDLAAVKACLLAERVADGAGATTPAPPKVDCSVMVEARFVAASGTLTLDLAPFVNSWLRGRPHLGVALLPNTPPATPPPSWHLAFDRRDRAGGLPITTAVRVAAGPVTGPPPDTGPVVQPPVTPDGFGPVDGPVAPDIPDVDPYEPIGPQTDVAPQARVMFDVSYRYSRAFYVPLLFLWGLVFFARLFTQDALPAPARRT